MQRRQFNGADDLAAMQQLVAERTEALGLGSNLHPGDIAHRIYNGLRREQIDDVVAVWTEADRVEAFGILWPKYQAFDIVTRLTLDDDALHAVVAEVADLATAKGRVETDVIGDDHRLREVLEDLGFSWFEDGYAFTAQSIPEIVDEDASEFAVRSVTRADAAAWSTGRAGMLYRDLVPDRQGGRFIASHIRLADGGPVPDHVHFHDHIRQKQAAFIADWLTDFIDQPDSPDNP